MSDLRLEDLRVWIVPDPHDESEAGCPDCDAVWAMTRPVARGDVLAAIGAVERWVCAGMDPFRCDEHTPLSSEHENWGWKWVVDDAT